MSSTVVGPGQVIADRYLIERWLGQGGMGSVYRAVQLSVHRTVALKRLVDEHLESASHVERFEREALALSRLSHQNTVRLFDFGTDERGCPFIVMEYLEGADLATDLERHGPMRWDHALQVGIQILGSLAEAHAAGIVHRDIKPANVFLCTGPEWPVVKVLDFGIAGGAELSAGVRKLTVTGTVVGSAPYMSPEQAQGFAVGPAADLYSFGVVLFEMLTGRTPFGARPLTAQLLAKVLEAAPALRDVCPELEVPAELHALVTALLERDAERRPASARATAECIEALLLRAALPPVSRAAQQPKPASAEIPKTEPMLVPRTLGDGWAPNAPSGAGRPRRELGWSMVLGATAVAATAWLWRGLSSPSPERHAPAAVLRALPASNADWSESEVTGAVLDAGIADAAATSELVDRAAGPVLPASRREPALFPSDMPAAVKSSASATREASTAMVPRRPAARNIRAEPRQRAASIGASASTGASAPPKAAPSKAAPSKAAVPSQGLPSPAEPLAPAHWSPRVDPRYWTVAAARAAARRGEITPAQRNEIIVALRERRLQARARAARAYREGRIGFEELVERQDAIDRRIDGW